MRRLMSAPLGRERSVRLLGCVRSGAVASPPPPRAAPRRAPPVASPRAAGGVGPAAARDARHIEIVPGDNVSTQWNPVGLQSN